MSAAATAILGWMAALADATRVRLLRLLERHELTVSELCAVLQLPQSTVSRHLKVLARRRLGGVGARRAPAGCTTWLDAAASPRRSGSGRCRATQVATGARGGAGRAPPGGRARAAAQPPRRSSSPARRASGTGCARELFGGRFDAAGAARAAGPGVARGRPRLRHGPGRRCSSPVRAARRRGRRPPPPCSRRRGAGLAAWRTSTCGGASWRRCRWRRTAGRRAAAPGAAPRGGAARRAGGGGARAAAGRPLCSSWTCSRTSAEEYRQQMGHVWLGFEPEQLAGLLHGRGLQTSASTRSPRTPRRKGPRCFAVACAGSEAAPFEPGALSWSRRRALRRRRRRTRPARPSRSRTSPWPSGAARRSSWPSRRCRA